MITLEDAKKILLQFGADDERTIDKFLSQVKFLPNGCWEWQGAKDKDGYGIFAKRNGTIRAHRIAYSWAKGPLPKLLEHDVCDYAACVNPHHCKPSDDRHNVLKGRGPTAINFRKTHCNRGHPFTEKDRLHTTWDGWVRRCRKCKNMKRREAYAAAHPKPARPDEADGRRMSE
jgi:hypothetical protein